MRARPHLFVGPRAGAGRLPDRGVDDAARAHAHGVRGPDHGLRGGPLRRLRAQQRGTPGLARPRGPRGRGECPGDVPGRGAGHPHRGHDPAKPPLRRQRHRGHRVRRPVGHHPGRARRHALDRQVQGVRPLRVGAERGPALRITHRRAHDHPREHRGHAGREPLRRAHRDDQDHGRGARAAHRPVARPVGTRPLPGAAHLRRPLDPQPRARALHAPSHPLSLSRVCFFIVSLGLTAHGFSEKMTSPKNNPGQEVPMKVPTLFVHITAHGQECTVLQQTFHQVAFGSEPVKTLIDDNGQEADIAIVSTPDEALHTLKETEKTTIIMVCLGRDVLATAKTLAARFPERMHARDMIGPDSVDGQHIVAFLLKIISNLSQEAP